MRLCGQTRGGFETTYVRSPEWRVTETREGDMDGGREGIDQCRRSAWDERCTRIIRKMGPCLV